MLCVRWRTFLKYAALAAMTETGMTGGKPSFSSRDGLVLMLCGEYVNHVIPPKREYNCIPPPLPSSLRIRPPVISRYSMSSAPSLSPSPCLSPSSPAVKLWKEFGEGDGRPRPLHRTDDGVSQLEWRPDSYVLVVTFSRARETICPELRTRNSHATEIRRTNGVYAAKAI